MKELDLTLYTVMVVDDQPINVQILKHKLQSVGLKVYTAQSGDEALGIIQTQPHPDLILLDVMMPNKDGYEVCKILKMDSTTRQIPIIFVTAKHEKNSKLTGFEIGAIDYITKPIDLDETLARVKTQLNMLELQREVARIRELEVEMKNQKQSKILVRGLTHNLNNHLSVAQGYIDLIKSNDTLNLRDSEMLKKVTPALQNIQLLIKQLGLLNEGTNCKEHVDIPDLIRGVNFWGVPIKVEIEKLYVDKLKLRYILNELLKNALEATNYDCSKICLEVIGVGNTVEFKVVDTGVGLDPVIASNLFTPMNTTKKDVGVGMSLSICSQYARVMDATLSLMTTSGVTVGSLTFEV